MVQIYNPNVVGKQILIDVKNIESDRLKTVEMIMPFMDRVVKELNLNVTAIIKLQKENDELKNNAYSKVAPSELNKNAILEKNKVIFV